MDSSGESGMVDPAVTTGYDDYLGGFVDAVQDDAGRYAELRARFTEACPDGWRERFTSDAAEIEALLEAGAFGRAEDAA